MTKIHILLALTAGAFLASPAYAQSQDRDDRRDRTERVERAEPRERAQTPYSNRAQFQRRQITRSIREAQPRPRYYRFRRSRERSPE